MGEAVGAHPGPIYLPIKKNPQMVNVEPGLPLLPKTIADPIPLTSDQDAFQLSARIFVVILNARHVTGLSFWKGPEGIYDEAQVLAADRRR